MKGLKDWWKDFFGGRAERGSHTWNPPLFGVQADPPCDFEGMRVVSQTGFELGVFCCSLPALHKTQHESYDDQGRLLAWHDLEGVEILWSRAYQD